jgi:succinyl-diaminopimelate desuccinylase
MPETGFSPDANFPVIYAEKGIYHVRVDFPVTKSLFTAFEGGERVNMVCDRCTATPLSLDGKKAKALGLTVENGNLLSVGKSAHGSTPEEGKNAILPMLQYFADDKSISHVIDCTFEDKYGLKSLSDETGTLTLSPDLVSYREGILSLTIDIRYPSTLPLSAVTEKLDLFGVEYTAISHQPPLFSDKNGPLVSTLCKVYNKYAKKNEQPIAIGGGTYARALKNGAAFGPEIEGEEVTIHQANEYITLDRIALMLDVYSEAIKELTK